ncbi:MAG: dual specificity protein phosphatase family protein, partial [Actinomycetia bacterium]|nr:dual specificity protein phosphatase family protein [Actinomycetes bacterium]
DQITISGDLHEDPQHAATQIDGWQRAGITHVLDTRFEWSDEELVAEHAPDIVYGWIRADDDGAAKPDEWFDAGLTFSSDALSDPDAVVLVHCHMGINRGPSMAYRILLESGWDPIEALDAIRDARPIADIGYAEDALDHYHRSHDISTERRTLDRDSLVLWRHEHHMSHVRLLRTQD